MSSPQKTDSSAKISAGIASKTLDETNFDEPSTSTGVKIQYTGNITISLGSSKTTVAENEPLSSLDDLASRLLAEKGNIENDSFITVDGCREERATSTEPTGLFARNEQIQNAVAASSPPPYYQLPPPYDPQDNLSAYQSIMGRTRVYQDRHAVLGQVVLPQDASGAPQYRRRYNSPNIDDFLDAFDSTKIRNQFAQRVYMILSCQLLLAFGIMLFCKYEKNTRHFIQQDRVWCIASLVLFIVFYMVLFCYQETRRIFPLNFMLLLLLTLSLAYMAAVITCVYSTQVLIVTFGVTASVCILISLLGFQQSFEVTECGMAVCLFSLIITVYIMMAMVMVIATGTDVGYLIFSCLMTLVFSMYLLYDTQQILGAQRIQLSPEEYILGATQLYVDIMITFVALLCIFRNS